MFERHTKRIPLLTASILCTAIAVSAQEGDRKQDPTRNQDPQALQAAMKDKFAKFEDVKGATVYMKTPSAGGQDRGAADDRAAGGTGTSGGGEKIGQIVDVIVHTSSNSSGSSRIGSPGVTTGMPGLAEAVVKVAPSSSDSGRGNQKAGQEQGQSGQQIGSTGGDRTVRVPLAMFEWDADQERLSFTRTRAEFDAMPVLIITITEIEPAATPPGGIGREQGERGERGQTGGRRGQEEGGVATGQPETGKRNAGQDQTLQLTKASNAKLESKDGQQLGQCEHIVLDMEQGEAAFVLASLQQSSGSGGELAVIPWRAVKQKSSGTAEASGQRDQTGRTGEQKEANKDEEKGEYGEKTGQKHMSGSSGSLTLVVDLEASKLQNAPKMSANDLTKLTDPEFRMKILEVYRDFEQPGTGREEQGSGRGR